MSARYSDRKLPQTNRVRKAIAESEASQGSAARRARVAGSGLKAVPPTEAQACAVTHRLRLFEYHCDALKPHEHIYISVWDSNENPIAGEAVPKGEAIQTFEGPSRAAIEIEASRFCREELGTAEIVNWRDLGTI